jgi:hypothetical protein
LNRGGLGITNLERFGRALRLHWLWHQWKSPRKLWRGYELPVDATDEALFAATTKVIVHNSRTTKFWSSSWLAGGTPAMMFSALFQHSRHKNRTMANSLRDGNWIRDVLHDITPALLLDYTMLRILVNGVAFDPEEVEDDDIVWTRSASGEYSAKLAYNIQFDGSTNSTF